VERIVERPGALDVHKASVTACVRVWEGRKLTEHVAEFKTTVHDLLALRDWLEALAVRHVVMEATGVYWRPVWAVLEDRFELMLVNARHVKQCVRGARPTCSTRSGSVRGAAEGELRATQADPHPGVGPGRVPAAADDPSAPRAGRARLRPTRPSSAPRRDCGLHRDARKQ
jgi:transposase